MNFAVDDPFYRSLVEDANDMIAVFGDDGIVVHVNAASERLLGFTPAQAVGTNFVTYLHPGEIERALYTISQMDANPLGLANGSYLLRHADGSWVPADVTASRITHNGLRLVVVSCRYSVAPRIERKVLLGLLNRASLDVVM